MIRDEDILTIDAPSLTAGERLFLPAILGGMKTTLRHMFALKQRRTVQYPEEKRKLRVENYRGVHRLNRDHDGRVACVACYMCSTACPAHCIHIEAGESPWPDREKYPVKFDIDELRCIYCGMCEEACPVDAIELTPDYSLVGRTRDEMILGKEELLAVFDATRQIKPRKDPHITGYPNSGRPEAGRVDVVLSETAEEAQNHAARDGDSAAGGAARAEHGGAGGDGSA
ncbi:MAG: NADH-quinone oxidoreductase subunit I [Phycisphaerae bacterium]|nr:MAG: NADH-quinone oxidoreductase subunit I [Planctomycetota bacterium]KAB2938148.1 MAG: NADH-quinone oxidoreductase subunit I [Phycisphaerae bacterium]MCL4719200.1 NADH-quinone oxidoreductase subunit I [Phycisphaerae bacterium]MCQ3921434.1 NADH-quinone oxidoreductase subunit I [Planctomycetota bacterium]